MTKFFDSFLIFSVLNSIRTYFRTYSLPFGLIPYGLTIFQVYVGNVTSLSFFTMIMRVTVTDSYLVRICHLENRTRIMNTF
jgi:hypothetical protein